MQKNSNGHEKCPIITKRKNVNVYSTIRMYCVHELYFECTNLLMMIGYSEWRQRLYLRPIAGESIVLRQVTYRLHSLSIHEYLVVALNKRKNLNMKRDKIVDADHKLITWRINDIFIDFSELIVFLSLNYHGAFFRASFWSIVIE